MSRLVLSRGDGSVESIGLPCRAAVLLSRAGRTLEVRQYRRGEAFNAPVLAPAGDGHVLLTPPGVISVTGLSLLAGTCRLVDGDTMRLRSTAVRYSTHDFVDPERLEPLVLPQPGQTARCAACMSAEEPLVAGAAVVYCPGCQWAFHPECISDGVSACPVCSCAVCADDEARAEFILRGSAVKEANHE